MEIRTGSGETRRLDGLDAQTPFTSVGGLVQGGGWLTDFDVLDEGDKGDGEVLCARVLVFSFCVSFFGSDPGSNVPLVVVVFC